MAKLRRKAYFKIHKKPSNRYEVFSNCIANHYPKIIGMGLCLLLFAVPFLVFMFIKDSFLAEQYASLNSGRISQETFDENSQSFANLANIIEIVGLVAFGYGVAGILQAIKNMCWKNKVNLIDDIFMGIQMHGNKLALIFLAVGVLNYFDATVLNTNIHIIFKILVLLFSLTIVFPLALYVILEFVVYEIKLGRSIKYGTIIFFKTCPISVLVSLANIVPIGLLYVNNVFVKYIEIIALIIFFLPLFMIVTFLYSNYVFDQFINKKYYPDLVDKGITRII